LPRKENAGAEQDHTEADDETDHPRGKSPKICNDSNQNHVEETQPERPRSFGSVLPPLPGNRFHAEIPTIRTREDPSGEESHDFGGALKPSLTNAIPGDEEGDNSPPLVKPNDSRELALGEPNPLGDTTTERTRGATRRRPALTGLTFNAATKAYLEGVRPYYRASTLERTARDLNTIARDLRVLSAQGKISTTNPRSMSERDVEALLLRWRTRTVERGTRSKSLDVASQAHLVKVLANFLAFLGNAVIEAMRRKRHVRFPREMRNKPIRVLSTEELERIRIGAESLEGWRASVARLLLVLAPACAMRPSELRLARMEDLDLKRWTPAVEHPKGEGSWAPSGLEAPILPFAEQAVLDYLEERRAFLGSEDHEALLPMRWSDGTLSYWSEAALRKLIREVSRISGVRFSLKDLRSTFAQMAKDRGAEIEAVSRALRHGSTRTTELYYARMRPEEAFRELRRAFETPEVRLLPKTVTDAAGHRSPP
jgi:integrase